MRGEIHQYDINTAIRASIQDQLGNPVDLSTSTQVLFVFGKPNGVVASGIGQFVTDGKDGQVQYISKANDLDIVGNWALQIYVAFPGSLFHSDKTKFFVYPNLM